MARAVGANDPQTLATAALLAIISSCATAPRAPIEPQPRAPDSMAAQNDDGPNERPAKLEVKPIDLSPAPPPAGLYASVRVANPNATWKAVFELLGLADAPIAEAGPAFIAGALFNAPPQILDLGAPLDALVRVREVPEDGNFRGSGELALSAALYGREDAAHTLGRFFSLENAGNGALRFDASREGSEGERLEKRCEIAPAAGLVSARLVCADSAGVLDNLSPYLTRTVAKDAPPSDVRVDLSLRALHAIFEKKRDEDLAMIDSHGPTDPARRAGQKFGSREGYELLRDVDGMTLEASHANAGVQLDLVLSFAGGRPFLQRVLMGSPTKSAPAPDSFWALPADTGMAFFSHGVDAADLQPLRQSMFDVLRGSLTDEEIDPLVRERLSAQLGQLFLTGGPVVLGAGDAGEKGRWYLAGMEEPAERWKKGIEGLIAIDKQVGKQSGKAVQKNRRQDCERVAMSVAPAGKNITHVEVKTTPIPCAENKGEKLGPPELGHAFIVADGAKTWIAFGSNPALLKEKIRVVQTKTPSETLARVPGLDALRSENMTHGGFLSLFALRRALEPRMFPFTTQTPIAFAFSPRAGDQNSALAIKVTFATDVVRELIEMIRAD